MKLKQVATGKAIAINSPIFFFAQDREIADEAFPGDIIGIPNHGVLRVGDSLVEKDDVTFTGIPNFAPEILRRVRLGDPTKSKQLRTALTDMAEEGVTQLFKPLLGSQWVVGVVGQLQLEVLISRLEAEYRVAASFEPSPYETARWISGAPAELKRFIDDNRGAMAEDRDGAPVFMARDSWELNYVTQRETAIRFSATRERA
jgi:peptide chain release factor 3